MGQEHYIEPNIPRPGLLSVHPELRTHASSKGAPDGVTVMMMADSNNHLRRCGGSSGCFVPSISRYLLSMSHAPNSQLGTQEGRQKEQRAQTLAWKST